MNCPTCGDTLAGKRRDARYCSPRCRRQAFERRYEGASDSPLVCFIQGEGVVQITLSRAPGMTLRILRAQQGSGARLHLVAVLPGDKGKLASVHGRFAALRRHGRWFAATPDLLDYIRRHARPA